MGRKRRHDLNCGSPQLSGERVASQSETPPRQGHERRATLPEIQGGRIWSEKFKTVSTNGIHVATQVGELVFDNFYPDGIPVAEWQRDMGADTFEDLSMSQEEFRAPGCIDD